MNTVKYHNEKYLQQQNNNIQPSFHKIQTSYQ